MSKFRPKIGGAVYILPNLLTAGNLFFGYFSIIKSLQGEFFWAASAILLGSIFDVLDGQVARLTRGTSEFGVQFDSLCDLISFGLAPSFLAYQYILSEVGRIGWILGFIFLACGALRLARFNVQSSIGKTKGDFVGLPIPMAAGVVACFVGLSTDPLDADAHFVLVKIFEFLNLKSVKLGFFIVMTPFLALMMVSNFTYRSHKSMKIRSIKPFRLLAILVTIVALAAYLPMFAGSLFFFLYSFSGPLEWILGWKKAADEDEIFEQEVDEEETPLRD